VRFAVEYEEKVVRAIETAVRKRVPYAKYIAVEPA